MTEDITILSLEDRERWVAEHAAGGLPSQSWNFARGLSASGEMPKLAVVRAAGGRMLLPFFERHWRGTTDIATIAGISGASIVPSTAAPLRLWSDYAAGQGWVAGYIRLAITVDLDDTAIAGQLVTNNVMLVLDLRGEPDAASFSRTIRRKIRGAAERNAVLVDDRPRLAEALQRLYPRTMQRVGAAPEFAYSAETIERWAFDPTSELLGAAVAGSIEAVYLFVAAGAHAESHMLGCTDAGRDLTAWLIWHGLRRLRDRGVRYVNLTGGMRPEDGIYRFKQGFNPSPVPKRAVHQIYDRARYDELCRQAGVSPGGNWFPAYRRPR